MKITVIKETGRHYYYKNGVFIPFTDTEIKHKIKEYLQDVNKLTDNPIKFSTSLFFQVKNNLHGNMKSLSDFDKKPNILNVKNGWINLEDGTFLPHWDLTEDITVNVTPSFIQIPIEYDKDAECLIIDQFLTDVFGFDRVPLIYEIISYILYKSNKLHKSFIFFGEASSGKTSFIEMIRSFLGCKNITDISIQNLNKRFQMANLKDKMANIYDDLPIRKLNYIANFKQVVTNNSLTGELKGYQGSITWQNFCKLVFTTNTLPEVSKDTGEDFWRRIMLIHCTEHFDNGKKDFDIIDKITTDEELSGLLNKCVRYLPDLLKRKHFDPKYDNIDNVKGIWLININPLKLFLDTSCILKEDAREEVHYFRNQLNLFREDRNALPISQNLITRKLKDLGIEKKRQKEKNFYYIGIKITTTIIDQIESIILGGKVLDEF